MSLNFLKFFYDYRTTQLFSPVSSHSFVKRGFNSTPSLFAGHSKWHNIRHKKAKNDLARSNQFSKISKEITVSVKLGGKDLEHNVRLVSAISKAKELGFSREGIEYAIQKGVSDATAGSVDEITYEGYGPGGVAVMVHAMTTNKNRSSNFVRHTFAKHGGNLGSSGTVGWAFDKKGIIIVNKGQKSEDELIEAALDSGAEDVHMGSGENSSEAQITCGRTDLIKVKRELESRGFTVTKAQLALIPNQTVSELAPEDLENLEKMLDIFEENEDVQSVDHNYIGEVTEEQ